MRWKNIGETTTENGHKLYYSGLPDVHEQGVGFHVHRNYNNCVVNCYPISSRLISIRLKASPFNITIIQAYAPTSTYDDEAVEKFYDQLQEVVNKVPKKDILVVQGDCNAKVGSDSYQTWKGTCGKYSNLSTNEQGQRLFIHTRMPQKIAYNHMAQSERRAPQPDRLYHGATAF
uniref:Endonuclease/exonuclease/phosphatase domain-containing protein n=1 Tax=Biomphalaria glabrata TaxID=6526 RepID=A0A2C9KHG7_BIOGL